MNVNIQSDIFDTANDLGWLIATAESCTGGLIAAALTCPAGASSCIAGGIVTYSNAMKHALLHVPADCFDKHGAVSHECVAAMAKGCLKATGAQLALSVSGIAGPTGDSPEKPLGLVYFGVAAATDDTPATFKKVFDGDRQEVREQAKDYALTLIAERLQQETQNNEKA